LENLLRNAKSNQDYNLRETIDQVMDFLLSDRGEYMRDRLVDELVKGIEAATAQRLPKSFRNRANTNDPGRASQPATDTSFDHLAAIWSILQQDRQLQSLDIVPIAGRILLKPETQAMGRNILSQLAQRALARIIREMVLRDEREAASKLTNKASERSVLAATGAVNSVLVGKHLSRQVNGRSW
jgi:hypothetical protein